MEHKVIRRYKKIDPYKDLTFEEIINKFKAEREACLLREKEAQQFRDNILDTQHYTKDTMKLAGIDTSMSDKQLKEVERLRDLIKSNKISRKHDPSNILNDYFYEYYLRYTEKYHSFKTYYYLGLFLWMTAVFWMPFVIGIFTEGGLLGGIGAMSLFSFTTPITLPLSFIIGLCVHPKFIKEIIFNDEYPYSDYWNKQFGLGENQEAKNKAAVLAGTTIGSIIK